MTDVTPTHQSQLRELAVAFADAGRQRDDPGYPHDNRCIAMLVSDWLLPHAAINGAHIIESYNTFSSYIVTEMLLAVREADSSALFAWGREGSPVLYIECDDADAVMNVLGPDAYTYPDDPMFTTGRPHELGRISHELVGKARQPLYGSEDSDRDVHAECTHESPPVTVDEYAETTPDREYVRAWWD